ncbi:MAG: transcriptional regulator [Anaerolineae bacterium]|nr:transcriptional regulator [Gloeobacterales cyanobacterium ES-bin-313]
MFSEGQIEQVFDLLRRVAKAVAVTVGKHCEVVVHDLRDPEHTVVAISGNLTDRTIGSPAPDPEFLPENVNRFQADYLLYPTRTPAGLPLLSSSVWVRDHSGRIIGAICVNMDFGNLRLARDLIDAHLNSPQNHLAELETFATSPDEFASIALRKALQDLGKPVHTLTRQEKIGIIHKLDQLGIFRFRQSVDLVMAELGISRASVYEYLKKSRTNFSQMST